MPAVTRSSSRSRIEGESTPSKSVGKQRAQSKPGKGQPSWGRRSTTSWTTSVIVAGLLAVCPVMTLYFWSACTFHRCSLVAPVRAIAEGGHSAMVAMLPQLRTDGAALYVGWVLFQAALYALLPVASLSYGQLTPAGNLLPYKANGLTAYLLTHAIFIGGAYFGLFSAAIIHDYWGQLFVAANIFGYALALFSYIKAHFFPTHAEDRKFTGSMVYDFFMGIELNPRIGKLWDFKLFFNGRPGIVAWTLIDLSFAFAQYQRIGYVTNSMLLVNLFHAMYVIDFFINEDWYLRTIDIAQDHFGFYLAWGDTVWLPFMYTLQSHYLVRNPVDLPPWGAAAVLALGLFGYYIFRAVNHQKDLVRKTDGKCMIWGKPAKVIRAKYLTSDGKENTSLLLISGWWGFARHFNYTGDLMLSSAMCLACGFGHLLPYFYIIFMTILLVHRIYRDNDRCQGKYGKYWDQYKEAVKYKLIPYVF